MILKNKLSKFILFQAMLLNVKGGCRLGLIFYQRLQLKLVSASYFLSNFYFFTK